MKVSWAKSKDIRQNESLNEYWKKKVSKEEGPLESRDIDGKAKYG